MVGYGVEEEDRKHTWMEDSEAVSLVSRLSYVVFVCGHQGRRSGF